MNVATRVGLAIVIVIAVVGTNSWITGTGILNTISEVTPGMIVLAITCLLLLLSPFLIEAWRDRQSNTKNR